VKIVIDATNLLTRAYHAYPQNEERTWAIIGFANMALDTIKRYNPDQLHFCFDVPGGCWRHKLYSEYKANREEKHPHLTYQLNKARETMARLGFSVYAAQGFEADDLIATLTTCLETPMAIMSGDKDLMCLVRDGVGMIRFTSHFKNQKIIGYDSIMAEYGFPPESLPHMYALMGDAGDNVPGVFGIGEVNADKLIKRYRTLDNLYDHVSELGDSLRGKLITGHDKAELSLALINMRHDVPLQPKNGWFTKEAFHSLVKIVRNPE